MAGAVNTIGQSKRGGGDRSSRSAQLEARENEQKALSLWIKGATYQQIAAAGFGIASAKRCLALGWPGAGADPQAGGRSGSRSTASTPAGGPHAALEPGER